MKNYIVIRKMNPGDRLFNCFEFGWRPSMNPENCWVGHLEEGKIGYTFFKRGPRYGDFILPPSIPYRIVMGDRDGSFRRKFHFEDEDDTYLLFRKVGSNHD